MSTYTDAFRPAPSVSTTAPDALDAFLSAATDAARVAGDVIRAGALDRGALLIERKRDNDFVSTVDKGAEKAIIELLAARFPDHAFRAEESGASGRSAYTWLIDPLDGTTNFLHGFPHYCVSIALQIGDSVAVGVVFDPVSARLFSAMRGRGAFLDGKPIRVSSRAGFAEAMLSTALPYKDWSYLDAYLDSLRDIMQRCAGVRRAGAAALDLAYVAAGWLDGHWERNVNAWDVGAGSLLVEEAGGVVSDFSGSPQCLDSGNIVAGTPGVHAELIATLSRYPAFAG